MMNVKEIIKQLPEGVKQNPTKLNNIYIAAYMGWKPGLYYASCNSVHEPHKWYKSGDVPSNCFSQCTCDGNAYFHYESSWSSLMDVFKKMRSEGGFEMNLGDDECYLKGFHNGEEVFISDTDMHLPLVHRFYNLILYYVKDIYFKDN